MVTKDEIMAIALKHDPLACWASDEPDENCLLIEPAAVIFLLDRDPTAYEDPNDPKHVTSGTHTRVVFPSIPAA